MSTTGFYHLNTGRKIWTLCAIAILMSLLIGFSVTSLGFVSDQLKVYSATNVDPSTKFNSPSLPDFVRLKAKCKVPEGSNRTSLPPCSHALFRKYYSTMKAFPHCGMWVETEGYGFWQRYILDFCELQAYNWPVCSLSKNMHHLLMMGDSTGWRLFMSMVNTTIWGGNMCKLVKNEGPCSKVPSKDYFSLGLKSLKDSLSFATRGCAWCRAAVYDCEMRTHLGFHTVRLEFVPAYKFRDISLTISPGNHTWRTSGTFQEFLFTTYLPKTGFPDSIVVAFPLNHEKINSRVVGDFRNLLDVMVEHVPRSTQIHWVPTASEFEGKRHSKQHSKARVGINNHIATKQINKINTQLFKVLKPYFFNASYNMHGFVNLVNMSSTKEDWNEDGVHFTYLWYAHVIRTLLSLLCGGS